mgnify:CR=1 FL=1
MRAALTLLAFLAACGASDPGLRLEVPGHAPTANDVERVDLPFKGHDGTMLYGQSWHAKTGEPRGVVVIHHGLADHSDRYGSFAERLVHAGFAVWSYDMRGHGRSAGGRIEIDPIDQLLDDLEGFLAVVRAKEGDRPLFLYGHSLGGLTVALYAIERQPQVAGVILAAPGIAFDTGPLAAAAVRFVAAIAPGAPILDTPHGDFSRDPAIVTELNQDPLVHQSKGPARTARASIEGVSRIWAHPERLIAPLLVVHGTVDKVTAPSGSRDLVAQAGTTDRTLRLYDGLNHDILHDPGGDAVAFDIVAWLDAHTGGAAVTAPPLPAGPLVGDRPSRLMAIELDVRGESHDSEYGVMGGVRFRLGVGGPLGYAGGIDLHGGYFTRARYEADLHALGIGFHSGSTSIALTGGIGCGGLRGAGAIRAPIELAVELALGPTRLLARGGLAWGVRGSDYKEEGRFADEASALIGLRFGRDVRYWSTVHAGAGPFLAGTFRDLGGEQIFGIALGGELWGAN